MNAPDKIFIFQDGDEHWYKPEEWETPPPNRVEYIRNDSLQHEQPELDLDKEFNDFLDNVEGMPRMWHSDEQLEWGKDIARHFYSLRNAALEKAAQHVYESWMGGSMDDVRRDMDEFGKMLGARKEGENKKTGIELIAEERKRQIEIEGWTKEHDAEHTNEALAQAAVCYATPSALRGYAYDPVIKARVPQLWPWDKKYWKPSPENRIKELVKAGALIAAEIDRLNAKKESLGPTNTL